MNIFAGTHLSIAPEILKRQSILKQSDLWSLGTII